MRQTQDARSTLRIFRDQQILWVRKNPNHPCIRLTGAIGEADTKSERGSQVAHNPGEEHTTKDVRELKMFCTSSVDHPRAV